MRNTAVILLLVINIALFVGSIFLQIFLSKRQNKMLGLILPILSFVSTLIIPLNMVSQGEYTMVFLLQMVLVLILVNIPTIIYLAIYFAYKKKDRGNKGLNKMNIQDLD